MSNAQLMRMGESVRYTGTKLGYDKRPTQPSHRTRCRALRDRLSFRTKYVGDGFEVMLPSAFVSGNLRMAVDRVAEAASRHVLHVHQIHGPNRTFIENANNIRMFELGQNW